MRKQPPHDLLVDLFCGLFGVKRGDIGKPVKAPTKVYRVEMPDGYGPYNSHLPHEKAIYDKLCDPEHGFDCARFARLNHEQCGITDEAFHKAHGEAEYGCLSLKAVGAWFPLEARRYLRSLSAQLVEYEVPKGGYVAKMGHGEVMFVRSKATRVRELDLVTLG